MSENWKVNPAGLEKLAADARATTDCVELAKIVANLCDLIANREQQILDMVKRSLRPSP